MLLQVRDLLTTEHEQQLKKSKQPGPATSLSKDAILVDAVVSTIGFPLVGGPAGTMEGGRQADVAKAILTAKNIPYVVAAPLLIQASLTEFPALTLPADIISRLDLSQRYLRLVSADNQRTAREVLVSVRP